MKASDCTHRDTWVAPVGASGLPLFRAVCSNCGRWWLDGKWRKPPSPRRGWRAQPYGRLLWAIECSPGACRASWAGLGRVGSYPAPMPALTVALFASRREARAALAKVKGPSLRGRYPCARVARVLVTVQETRAQRALPAPRKKVVARRKKPLTGDGWLP